MAVAPPSDAVLPQSNGLFVLTNTTAVTLTGLTLSDATWLLDSDGFVQAQAGCIVKGPAGYDSFRLNFHHFHRFELDLRGHVHVRGAALSWLRLNLADIVLI